ncbi:MAG: hypothetical protein HYT80_06305 [Euryarchaeota archaeon]|nr:hypothetical protein [Euryarchaeota archaeon]
MAWIWNRRRALGVLSIGLGALAGGAGLFHTIAVTHVALDVRHAYDIRLGTLLVVGLAVISFGTLMGLGGVGLIRGIPGHWPLSVFGASGMLLATAALTPADPSFAPGIVLFGAFLVLAPFLLRARGEVST